MVSEFLHGTVIFIFYWPFICTNLTLNEEKAYRKTVGLPSSYMIKTIWLNEENPLTLHEKKPQLQPSLTIQRKHVFIYIKKIPYPHEDTDKLHEENTLFS